MTFVNGELQARFMTRIRGLDPQRCLAVPVDVGKAIAVALVADHYGEIVVAPFAFALTETGFAQHVHGEFATFVHAAIFRGDGRLANPGLQSLDTFVVPLGDFGVDSLKVSSRRGGAA